MVINRLDDFVTIFNKEDIISHRQNRNDISSELSAIVKNEVASHSELKEEIENSNEDTFDVSFFYERIIKCN